MDTGSRAASDLFPCESNDRAGYENALQGARCLVEAASTGFPERGSAPVKCFGRVWAENR